MLNQINYPFGSLLQPFILIICIRILLKKLKKQQNKT